MIDRSYGDRLIQATFKIEEKEDDLRLDQFVKLFLKSHGRNEVKRKIQNKECFVTNRVSANKASSRLKIGDEVKIMIHQSTHEDEYWRGELLDLLTPTVSFEDDDLIVCNKPAFMSTHPTGRHLFNCATVFYEKERNLKTVHSVHRLDRETSGILLLAKNPKTANALTTEFENSNVKKCYLWISRKLPHAKSNKWTASENLGSIYEGRKRVIVSAFEEGSEFGKKALTDFEVLFENNEYAVGLAFPKTGRTHQIRVHAAVHGHPLIGDKLYLGGYPMFQRFKDMISTEDDCDELELPRHALHAYGIQINYQKESRFFTCNLTEDLQDFIKEKLHLDIDTFSRKASLASKRYFNLIKIQKN